MLARALGAVTALLLASTSRDGSAQDGSHVDPQLPAGVSLALLGASSMLAGGIWYGTHTPGGERDGYRSGSVGLFAGGLTAAVAGVGLMAAADRERERGPHVDALLGTGAFVSGLCLAGLVGSGAALAHGVATRDGSALWSGGTLMASVAHCGAGVPIWIVGMRPGQSEVAHADEERAGEGERWHARSPSMVALGSAMITTGGLYLAGSITGGVLAAQQSNPEGGREIYGGIMFGLMLSLPSAPLFVSGAFLVTRGGQSAPVPWRISLAPSAGGLAVRLDGL
jgi:hypothetical protein